MTLLAFEQYIKPLFLNEDFAAIYKAVSPQNFAALPTNPSIASNLRLHSISVFLFCSPFSFPNPVVTRHPTRTPPGPAVTSYLQQRDSAVPRSGHGPQLSIPRGVIIDQH